MSIIDTLLRNPDLIDRIGKAEEQHQIQRLYALNHNTPWNQHISDFLTYGATFNIGTLPLFNQFGPKLDVVKWIDGQVTLYRAPGDIISFDFGGCVMAHFLLKGSCYAAHIHNAEKICMQKDRRIDWAQFVKQQQIRDITMFQPGAEQFRRNGPGRGVAIWGIITASQQCYSVYVKDVAGVSATQGEYRISGIVHYPETGKSADFYKPILDLPDDASFDVVSHVWNAFWKYQQDAYEVLYSADV